MYFSIKPNEKNQFNKQIEGVFYCRWTLKKESQDGHRVNLYEVVIRRDDFTGDYWKSLHSNYLQDIKTLTKTANDEDVATAIKRNNINTWEKVFEQIVQGSPLTTLKPPIYISQHEKIIDVLHFVFMSERRYQGIDDEKNLVECLFPSYILPTNQNAIIDQLTKNPTKNATPLNAFTRYGIISLKFTEKFIQSIYGKSCPNPLIHPKSLYCYERECLSKEFYKQIEENSSSMNITLSINERKTRNNENQERYDDNGALLSFIRDDEYMLETVYLDIRNISLFFRSL